MHDTQITTMADLEQDGLAGAQVAGVELVAVPGREGVRVFAGRCPHQGTLLAEGHVENGRLTCRAHGWQFDQENGRKVDDPQTCLHQFSTQVENGRVLVDATEIAAWAAARPAEHPQNGTRPVRTPDQLPGPRSLPLLGNLFQLNIDRFHQGLEKWYQEFGDYYQFKMGREQVLVIADPDTVQKILQDRPGNFSRSKNIRQVIAEIGVEGLFNAEGAQWRRQRQVATRAFDVRHLREFFPVLVKVTRRLHNRWQRLARQQSPFDVQKELMRYTVDVTTNLAFGYDMNTLEEEGDRIQQHLEHIFPMIAHRAFIPVPYWRYIKLPADRALDDAQVELRAAVDQLIDHARQQLIDNPDLIAHPQNLLQALLAAQADEDVEFSDEEIYSNVITFLLAGEDTTANTMAWMFYFMTRYPEVQARMQAEADTLLVNGAPTITDYEQIGKVSYIEAVIHETMRFKPVAPFMGFQALTDVTINDLHIPEGMSIITLMRSKGLEEDQFSTASAFRPERWMDYDRRDNPHQRKSFAPFGGGPRLCPGRSLALLETKMAMSMICRHFEVVRADPGRDIAEKFVFTMLPEALRITLRPRGI